MRDFYYDFQIDKKPILVPDADIQMEFCDLDSESSGRDEGGFMHRIILRHNVRSWSVPYSSLTREEYRYMEALFDGKDKFRVDFRDHNGMHVSCTAYRSMHSITVHNVRTGTYKNYKFNIIEC